MSEELKPVFCCDRPLVPKWRIRSGQQDAAPRYVGVCHLCHKETAFEVTEDARKQLRYALVNDLLQVDPAVDNVEVKEGAEEPESVKILSKMMRGENDAAVAMRIWFDLRYAIKQASMVGKAVSWDDVKALVEAAMKRTRKQIKDVETRNQIIGRFIVMLKRVEEFNTHPEQDMAQKCEKCQLPKFICPCPKE